MGPPIPCEYYVLKTKLLSMARNVPLACIRNRLRLKIEASAEAEAPCQQALPGKTGSPAAATASLINGGDCYGHKTICFTSILRKTRTSWQLSIRISFAR
jgi:hypothetical protein